MSRSILAIYFGYQPELKGHNTALRFQFVRAVSLALTNRTRKTDLIKKIATITTLSFLALGLLAAPASAAPSTTSWGYWSELGTVTFDDASGTISAEYEVRAEGLEWLNSDDEGEYFVAASPIGKYFGASPETGNASGTNFIKVETASDTVTEAQVTIRFASEVPANRIALAISDIDWDKATVSMTDALGNDISAAKVKGKTPNIAFNFCTFTPVPSSCDSDKDKPAVSTSGVNVIAQGQGASSDGATFWVVPSAAVKTIKIVIINQDPTDSTSTQRIWLAQGTSDIEFPALPKLADTGTPANPTLWIGALGMVVLGALARRFAPKF